MANVKVKMNGAISAVCQSAAITKAGARPANRRAIPVPAISCIRNSSHHALGHGAVARPARGRTARERMLNKTRARSRFHTCDGELLAAVSDGIGFALITYVQP